MSILDLNGAKINEYIDSITSNYPTLGNNPCVSIYLLNHHDNYITLSVMYSANQMKDCLDKNAHVKYCKCRHINYEKFTIYYNNKISYHNDPSKLIYLAELGNLILDVCKKFDLFQ